MSKEQQIRKAVVAAATYACLSKQPFHVVGSSLGRWSLVAYSLGRMVGMDRLSHADATVLLGSVDIASVDGIEHAEALVESLCALIDETREKINSKDTP